MRFGIVDMARLNHYMAHALTRDQCERVLADCPRPVVMVAIEGRDWRIIDGANCIPADIWNCPHRRGKIHDALASAGLLGAAGCVEVGR